MLYQARIQYSKNLSEKLITYEIIINYRTKTVKAQQAAWSVLACGTASFAADIVSDGQSSVLGFNNYSPRTLHISRIRGLAPLKISLINKYRHRIDVQNKQWNRSIRTSPEYKFGLKVTDRF